MDQKTIELLKIKIEILKLKADSYDWVCHVPDNVKNQLNEMLEQINEELSEN